MDVSCVCCCNSTWFVEDEKTAVGIFFEGMVRDSVGEIEVLVGSTKLISNSAVGGRECVFKDVANLFRITHLDGKRDVVVHDEKKSC